MAYNLFIALVKLHVMGESGTIAVGLLTLSGYWSSQSISYYLPYIAICSFVQ
jgi:hypothetical protein